MGTSEVFYGTRVQENCIRNPLPPKKPLETIETPHARNFAFSPAPIFVDIYYRKPYSKPAATGSDFHENPWIFMKKS